MDKRSFFSCLLVLMNVFFISEDLVAQAAIGAATPNISAALDVTAANKGILVPRMSSAQRNAISSAATGLIVFDNTTSSFWFKSAGNWVELVDTSNNAWSKIANNTVLDMPGYVGIGTNFPNYDLHISRVKPSIYLYDTQDGHPSGTISGDTSDLKINAYRRAFSGVNSPGDIILQTGSGINTFVAGNVGIGISDPAARLHIYGSQRIDGELVFQNAAVDKWKIGISGDNVLFSSTDNNAFSQIKLGANGIQRLRLDAFGTKDFGSDASGSFDSRLMIPTNGEFNRVGVTNSADILPICYGKVKHDGTIISGSGNFSVSKTATGEYQLGVTGETNMYTNRNHYVIIVTPFYKTGEGGESIIASASTYWSSFNPPNVVEIRTTEFHTGYTNTNCVCGNSPSEPFTYISTTAYRGVDAGFSFMVYKN